MSRKTQMAGVAPASILAGIPEPLRNELTKALNEILRNFRERRWEPSELNGGKLCEVVYTILRGHIDGKFPAKASFTFWKLVLALPLISIVVVM